MKKILIVDKSFAVGGIQNALINLVKAVKDESQVDVLMFYNKGPLQRQFPSDVNVLEADFLMRIHGMSLAEARVEGFWIYILRLITGVLDRIFTNRLSIRLALLFQKKLKGYDVAIAFHHEDSPKATVSGFYRFVDKATDAPLKLGWIHYDPRFVSYNDQSNEKYMEKMDKIICVSYGTANMFSQQHPDLKVPIDYCYNMQDIDRILKLSKESVKITPSLSQFNCFSACRFGPQKAIPRAISALAPVLKDYDDVHWYIAGDGEDMGEVKNLISKYGIEQSVTLLGSLLNPYPYFSSCNLYIQPSIYEAAPMVYGEAMICKIPILTTDNISASEMVSPDYGIICENTENGLRESFRKLIEHRDVVAIMKHNLNLQQYSNSGIVEKINDLFKIG